MVDGSSAGGDDNECGELKVWEVKTGIIRTFEGHSQSITCIDISANSTLLASGVRYGSTIRVWNLKTGKLLFKIPASYSSVGAVRFSQDSKKLAVMSNWKYARARGIVTRAPVIWTETILAAFNFKDDDHIFVRTEEQWHLDHGDIDAPKTIYEFDASTLQTVRAPFEGHTNIICGLALSFDGALLASASRDETIKLWAFESRQLLTSFDVCTPDHLIFSSNSHQLAYTTWSGTKTYICDTPPHILATIQSAQEAQPDLQSSVTAPTTFKTRLHHRLTWRSARVGCALPPIVDVPLAPGRLRYAAADAPTFDEDLIRDKDYILSTHQNSQQPSTGVQVTTGQHGSGRLCGCFYIDLGNILLSIVIIRHASIALH
ncbi:WD40 repeat-like protein [Suillus hirtellus]|nr:WD40 repeat-like protein [Suillus hirtellus]